MHKPCGDGVDDTNAFAVLQMPDMRVLAFRVSLANDKKPSQDARASAEGQTALMSKHKQKLEAELKIAQDRLNYQSTDLHQVLSFRNKT